MNKKTISILLLFIVSSIARLWKLGEIPIGLSLQEVKFGLFFSKFLGNWVLDPLFVRLPFALVGIISIFLFFLLVLKMQQKFKVAYYMSAILAISPWHIMHSRIFSVGIIIFFSFLVLILLFFRYLRSPHSRVSRISLVLVWLIFICSIFVIPNNLREKVNIQRNIISEKNYYVVARLFSNRLVESSRYRTRLLFENIDFGNYFFSGHPRERWGVEEVQKLYIALIPLFLLGLMKFDRKKKIFLFLLSSIALVLPVIFQKRGSGVTLLLILPILLIGASGVSFLYRKANKKGENILYLLSLLFFLEFTFFANSYFIDSPESLFSPRRPIYKELVPVISSYLDTETNGRVLVSEKLGDPSSFIAFYLKNDLLDKVDIRDFSFNREDAINTLSIDVLSNTEAEFWFDEVSPVAEFYDFGKRHTVVVYTYPK